MTTAHFVAQIQHSRELCQLDYQREVVPRERQTMFCAEVPISCRTDDDTIDLEILLRTEVALARVSAEGAETDRENLYAVTYAAAKEAIPRLAGYGQWQLYEGEEIRIPGTDPIPNAAETYDLKQDEPLNPTLEKQLQEATARHNATATAFERAKEFLSSNINSLRHDPSTARRAARFLADCMRADGSPFMGAWNREKSAGLLGDVDELIRRKDTNHAGYRSAADHLSGILYTISPPAVWVAFPPQSHLLEI